MIDRPRWFLGRLALLLSLMVGPTMAMGMCYQRTCDCGDGNTFQISCSDSCEAHCSGGGSARPMPYYNPIPGLEIQLNALKARNDRLRTEASALQKEHYHLEQLLQALNGEAGTLDKAIEKTGEANTTISGQVFRTEKQGALARLRGDDTAVRIRDVSPDEDGGEGVPINGTTPRLLREPEPVPAALANLPSCTQTLATLKKEATAIHTALKGLDRSMANNGEVRAEAEQMIAEAARDGTKQLLGNFMDLTGRELAEDFKATAAESQRLLLKRTEEGLSRAQRGAIDKELKAIFKKKKDLAGIVQRYSELQQAYGAKELDDTLQSRDASSLEKAYAVGKTIAGNPVMKQIFRISEKVSGGFDVADVVKSDLDAGYLLGSEYLSWQNIKRLNRNSDRYLAAVDRLRARLEDTVRQMKTVETAMRGNGFAGCR